VQRLCKLREAFANIYAEIAQERISRELGIEIPQPAYPRIEKGAHTMAFIECLRRLGEKRYMDRRGEAARNISNSA
jgi:hypothetical protein